MYANPNSDDEAEAAGESLQVSAPIGTGSLTLSAAAQPAAMGPQGTVEATIASEDRHFYRQGSETLIRGAPLALAPRSRERDRGRVSAKDLVEELHSINSQIHRIMFQVEEAVARLATNG
jgi:hypothetical protein